MSMPLAERMRPTSLEDFVGQQHLVGENGPLRAAIQNENLPSIILWGPPGVGKTTLARILSGSLKRPFFAIAAINAGVKDVREILKKAKNQEFFNRPNPILFIDEIHRFNKAQQDALLGAVERGEITLIGATTENPSFEVISALLSRCQVYVLKSLEDDALLKLMTRASLEDEVLKERTFKIEETAAVLRFANGDARKLLNIVDLLSQTQTGTVLINDEVVTRVLQKQSIRFDKGGEEHYDLASAMIKSIRGSDPNAAVYYLARLVEGGEDIKFIARRLVISASEDIGMANPNALLLATSGFQAVNMIGYPEARIILSQVVVYLATSPKSNSSYQAIKSGQELVRQTGNLEIPLHLRNAPTKLMKELGYAANYQYAHGFEDHFVEQEYLPEKISGTVLYKPQKNLQEERIWSRLKGWWSKKYGY